MKSSNPLKYLQINNPPSKPHKIKPIFQHHATWKCIKLSDISYINKYRPKILHHIAITSLHSETLGLHGLRGLCKALTDSKIVSFLLFDNPLENANQLEYLLMRNVSFFLQERASPLHQEFIKALSRLGRCKKLSDLTLPNLSTQEHVNLKTAIRIYQQLKQLNQLKGVNLSIPLYDNAAILNYRLPQSLTNLHLDFKSRDHINQQQLSSFVASIQNCHLLEQFTLIFSKKYLIEPSDAEIWASFFQNAPKPLKKFHINFYFSGSQPLEGVQALIGSLKHLKQITALNLSSYHSWIIHHPKSVEYDYFPLVFNSLQSLTQLEILKLKLYSFRKIENHEIQDLASMLQSLKNLKSLVIQFPLFEYRGAGLISISQSLKHTTTLRTLDLRFPSSFRHEQKQILYNSLAHHHHLTSLCLDVRPSPYYHISMASTIKKSLTNFFCFSKGTSLFSNLQNFAQLSTLELGLSAVESSPREWKCFSLSLQKLTKLSSLSLSFAHLDSAKSFKIFQKFLSCLKNLPNLTQLGLAFEGSQILDSQVKLLSYHLAGCHSLTSLSLKFKNASQLKDESLYSLLSAIRRLSKLKDLSLLFEEKEAFGEKAISDFLEGLVVLKDLTRFYFIENQESIFDNQNVPLPQNLKGYESLRYLTHFIVNSSRYI